MISTIIVPLDGSQSAERAMPVAAALARSASARVVLFTASEGGVAIEPKAYLREQAHRVGLMDAEFSVCHDATAAQGLDAAITAAPDPLVVMTTRGHNSLGRAVLGSVAEHLLAAGRAPVVLIGPHVEPDQIEYSTIIVCDDGSDVAEAVVPIAATFARTMSLTPWIVQVVEPEVPKGFGGSPPERLVESSLVETVARRMREFGVEASYDVLHGRHPADAIVDYAKNAKNPIIAMATHGRTGLASIRLGSVAMAVVRHAGCPVLLVRPKSLG